MTKLKVAVMFAIVILLGSGSYTFFHYSNIKSTAVGVIENTSSNEITLSTSTSNIKYSHVTFYKEGENSAQYIKIQGGISDEIKQKINEVLFKNSSCFASTGTDIISLTSDLRDALSQAYDNEDTKPPYSEQDIMNMNLETLRTNLLKHGNWDESQDQNLVYADNNLLIIENKFNTSCGGVHPNDGTHAYNFDLSTGNEIEFKTIFKNFEKDKTAISNLILGFLKKEGSLEYEKECDIKDLDLEFSNFAFTKEGLKVYSLGYSHAEQVCEPLGAVIPYSVVLSYMGTNLVFMKSILPAIH